MVRWGILSFILLTVSICWGPPRQVNAETAEPTEVLIIYDTKANPPIIMGDGTKINWDKPGTTIELLRLVGDRLGIKVVFKRVPWNRGLFLVETNQTDGIFHASFKKTRLKIGVYPMKGGKHDQSRSILTHSYVLYKLRGSPVQWDGKDFTNVEGPIGATFGFAIVGDLEKMGFKVEEAKTPENSLRKLIHGRIAAYAELEGIVDPILEKNRDQFGDIEKVYPPLRSKAYYLMFSHGFYKNNRKVAERIWDEIKTVRNSEHFKLIVKRYIE